MLKDIYNDAESRMKGAVQALEEDLAGIRTGRASPALIERLQVDYYGALTPLIQLASIRTKFVVFESSQLPKSFVCDDDIFSPWRLDLIVPTVRPFRWMVDHAGTNHIQVDVYQTPQQMLSGFDGGCMVAVLPKSAFALFSLVVCVLSASVHELRLRL